MRKVAALKMELEELKACLEESKRHGAALEAASESLLLSCAHPVGGGFEGLRFGLGATLLIHCFLGGLAPRARFISPLILRYPSLRVLAPRGQVEKADLVQEVANSHEERERS